MFEQDYIMRQIKEMTAVIARVFFGRKTYKSFPMLEEAERQKAFALIEQIQKGEPKKAVEELDILTDNNTKENLIIGLEFFSQLSDMSEQILLKDGYSLVNARRDFTKFAKKFGLEQMTDLYFGENESEEVSE